MSNKCELCGKGIMRGNKVSHAKNRTHRICLPNIKKQAVDGKKIFVCMDCKSNLKRKKLK